MVAFRHLLIFTVIFNCCHPQREAAEVATRNISTINNIKNGTVMDKHSPENLTEPLVPFIFTAGQAKIYQELNFAVTGIYSPIITVIGIIGNSLTIFLLFRGVIESNAVVYLIGMSISDWFYLVSSLPWIFTAYATIINTLSWKAFYSYYLAYIFPICTITYGTSAWIVSAFTVERFLVVVFPFKAKDIVSRKKSKVAVVCMLLIGILVSLPRYFRYQIIYNINSKTNQTEVGLELSTIGRSSTFVALNFWMSFLGSNVIPFLVIGSLNAAIVICLRTTGKMLNKLQSTDGGKSEEVRNTRDNQITHLLLAIVIAFFVCNLPSAVMNAMVAITGSNYNNIAFRCAVLFAGNLLTTNTVINFFLYITYSTPMRVALRNMFLQRSETKIMYVQNPVTDITATSATM